MAPRELGPYNETVWIEFQYADGQNYWLYFHTEGNLPLATITNSHFLYKLPVGERAEFDTETVGQDSNATFKVFRDTTISVPQPTPTAGICVSFECPDGVEGCLPGQVPNATCDACVDPGPPVGDPP